MNESSETRQQLRLKCCVRTTDRRFHLRSTKTKSESRRLSGSLEGHTELGEDEKNPHVYP